MKRIIIYAQLCMILLIGMFASCEEEITWGSDYLDDKIVFDGFLSNVSPPYFFRLTYPSEIRKPDNENGIYKGVTDVEIVISDITDGIKDTLVKPEYEYLQYFDRTLITYYDYYLKKKVTEEYAGKSYDGIYVTTKLYGLEGHEYVLDINYKGKHYTAKDKMVAHTPITNLKVKELEIQGKGVAGVPCISFLNRPNEDNYYLLVHTGTGTGIVKAITGIDSFNGNALWPISILSDEFLEENVVDFAVEDGYWYHNSLPGSAFLPHGDSICVIMQSVSKECYNIYDQMIKQIKSDGGAYTPYPANIKSNISDGEVWGCFRVSAISYKAIKVDWK